VKFNGKPVATFYDLPAMLTEDVIGKQTEVEILREEKLATLTIEPKEAEEDEDD